MQIMQILIMILKIEWIYTSAIVCPELGFSQADKN